MRVHPGHLAVIAATLVAVEARGTVIVNYEVDYKAIRKAAAGTMLTLELSFDSACASPFIGTTIPIESVKVEVVSRVSPKGTSQARKIARIVAQFPYTGGDIPAYLTVTGTDVVPVGPTCQPQFLGPDVAPDSNRLGGLGAGEWVQNCGPGGVYARAEINGAAATSTLGATGVVSSFLCTGEQTFVRRLGAGYYYVVFDDGGSDLDNIGIRFDILGRTPIVSSQTAGVIASVNGPWQCADSPPPYVTCYIVEMRDTTNANVDSQFSIAFL